MQSFTPGSSPDFIANLPAVPQGSFVPGHGKNHLENVIAIVVPSKVSIPVPGKQGGV